MSTYACEPIHEKGLESDFLATQLRAFNAAKLPGYTGPKPFGLLIREQQEIIAGVFGWFSLGWFYLDLAWVKENFRRRGLGSLLMKELEAAVIAKGYDRIRAETGSFQSLPFYLHRGFEVYAENDVFAPNGEQHREFLIRKIFPTSLTP